MARRRMIDPSIWSDEELATLTVRQQLLYVGLFSNADDEGRLKGSPLSIRLMLPGIYRDLSEAEVRSDLDAVLQVMVHLIRYEVDSREYLEFTNYTRWQRIERPSASPIPSRFREHSGNDPGASTPIKEERLREEKGSEESERRARRAPRHRVPITTEEIERLVPEFAPALGGADEVRERIAAALNHVAVEKCKSEYLYVRTWLRGDTKKHQPEQRNGTTRHPAHGTGPDDADGLAALGKYG